MLHVLQEQPSSNRSDSIAKQNKQTKTTTTKRLQVLTKKEKNMDSMDYKELHIKTEPNDEAQEMNAMKAKMCTLCETHSGSDSSTCPQKPSLPHVKGQHDFEVKLEEAIPRANSALFSSTCSELTGGIVTYGQPVIEDGIKSDGYDSHTAPAAETDHRMEVALPAGPVVQTEDICSNVRNETLAEENCDTNSHSDSSTAPLGREPDVNTPPSGLIQKQNEQLAFISNAVRVPTEIHDDIGQVHECDICGKGFRLHRYMKDHKRKIHTKPIEVWPAGSSKPYERSFPCHLCSEWFERKTHLINHVRTLHSSEAPHECSICGERFETPMYLQRHVQKHIEEQPFHCDFCPFRFKRKQHLLDHVTCMHKIGVTPKSVPTNSNERPYPCTLCSKEFKGKKHLRDHIHAVHSSESPHECSICGERFRILSYLRQHAQTHVNERPFHCSLCPSKFKRKQHLLDHTACVHKIGATAKSARASSDERPFPCSVCPKRFKENKHLRVHVRIVHSTETPFECSVCGERFKIRSYLRRHNQKHIDERPFHCNHCPSKFTRKMHMLNHVAVVHHNETPFQCSVCEKQFKIKRHLRRHLCKGHNRGDSSSQTDQEDESSTGITTVKFTFKKRQ